MHETIFKKIFPYKNAYTNFCFLKRGEAHGVQGHGTLSCVNLQEKLFPLFSLRMFSKAQRAFKNVDLETHSSIAFAVTTRTSNISYFFWTEMLMSVFFFFSFYAGTEFNNNNNFLSLATVLKKYDIDCYIKLVW